jgi:hypothetical protein
MTFKTDSDEIAEILSWARPYASGAEQAFVNEYVAPLAPLVDAFGNHMVRIGQMPVIWSCHTDTVHARGGRQTVHMRDGVATLTKGKAGMCLGADDGAGVWLMRQMILAERPGLYIFHRGEERGGLGSAYIADHTPEVLAEMDCAVAFDRKGTSSLITHQSWDRCCSDQWARGFIKRLNLPYQLDDSGVFTDTANYTHLVPECTNLSVGYEREHGPTEWLDVGHLCDLRDAVCTMSLKGLAPHRIARHEPIILANDDYDDWHKYRQIGPREYDEDELTDVVRDNPEGVANLLRQYGLSAADVLDFIG